MKYISLLAVLIVSCATPKQKYDRLVAEYPDLVDTDTVTITDTIVETFEVPVPQFEDSFVILHDTIIETEKLIIKKKGKHFGVTVKPDTITYRDTIPYKVQVPGRIVKQNYFNFERLFIVFVCGILLGILLGVRYRKH